MSFDPPAVADATSNQILQNITNGAGANVDENIGKSAKRFNTSLTMHYQQGNTAVSEAELGQHAKFVVEQALQAIPGAIAGELAPRWAMQMEANMAQMEANINNNINAAMDVVNNRITDLEANMNERFSNLRAYVNKRISNLQGNMNNRFHDVNNRIDDLEGNMNNRFLDANKRIDDLEGNMNNRFHAVNNRINDLEGNMDNRFNHVNNRIAAQEFNTDQQFRDFDASIMNQFKNVENRILNSFVTEVTDAIAIISNDDGEAPDDDDFPPTYRDFQLLNELKVTALSNFYGLVPLEPNADARKIRIRRHLGMRVA